jgi:hypothetical protein
MSASKEKTHNTRGLKEVAKARSMISGTGGGNRSKSKPRRTKGSSTIYGGPNMYPLVGCPGWFTNATPPHLQTDENKYVIRWDLDPKSYYRQMTAIGPAFGATLAETPRFGNAHGAQVVIDGFGMVAKVGSVVETVLGRLHYLNQQAEDTKRRGAVVSCAGKKGGSHG